MLLLTNNQTTCYNIYNVTFLYCCFELTKSSQVNKCESAMDLYKEQIKQSKLVNKKNVLASNALLSLVHAFHWDLCLRKTFPFALFYAPYLSFLFTLVFSFLFIIIYTLLWLHFYILNVYPISKNNQWKLVRWNS
jgi:hypothetical protein